MSTTPTLSVPELYSFTLLETDTIESLRDDLGMSKFNNIRFTTQNFGMSRAIHPLRGGFLHMEGEYSHLDALNAVADLVQSTGRRFRLGTPLEALVFKKSGNSHPPYWAVLSKVYGKAPAREVLLWDCAVCFYLSLYTGRMSPLYEVFIVEEL